MPPATTRTSPRLKGGSYKVTKASPEKAGSGKKPLTTPQERAARRNAITNESLSELRNQCIASGINPDGTRPELMKRLLANQNFGEIGDAILVTEARLPGQNSSISDVKETLRVALESTTFNVREIKGRNFLGDDESLEYAAAKMDLPEVRETVRELEKQVSDLRNELEQYKALAIGIRHRFINTYKRRFRRMTIYEVRQIERTSHKIHSGDAVGDAEFFVSRQRTDVWVYEKLYWFTPHEVMGFADNERAVDLVSAFATIKTLKDDRHPERLEELETRMTNFITQFKQSGYPNFSEAGNVNTDLHHACVSCRDFIQGIWNR